LCTGVITGGIAHPPPPPTPPVPIIKGAPTVLVGSMPLSRWIIDTAACGTFLGDPKLAAARKVFIGP
jgi:hypothetical protein